MASPSPNRQCIVVNEDLRKNRRWQPDRVSRASAMKAESAVSVEDIVQKVEGGSLYLINDRSAGKFLAKI